MSARRPLLWPLTPLYAAGLRLKERRLPPAKHLHFPVISIGSIAAGGAGKTPMTRLLIDLLRQRGFAPAVLSRGYKRQASGIERVDPDGDAQQFGDEPLLLARSTGAPVYVGADRHAAGLLAEQHADERTLFLLDDGFQHRGLARDLDIVLLTRRDAEDALLPAGDLREPLRALRRADIIVLREEEAARLLPKLRRWTDATVWQVKRSLRFQNFTPNEPLAFCGIARPDGFVQMLRAAGCKPIGHMFFSDHHACNERDLHRLIRRAQRLDADAFVTTEKDMVRLSAEMRSKLEYFFPIAVAELQLELRNADTAIDDLLARLRSRRAE